MSHNIQEKEKVRDEELSKKNRKLQLLLKFVFFAALAFTCATHLQYFSEFSHIKPSGENPDIRAAYGQYGDFIGGSLNPILSFLSLIAVLFTVSLQITELQQNREELRETREVAVQQKQHFENEAKKTEIMQALQQYETEYEKRISVKTEHWGGQKYDTVSEILNRQGETAARHSYQLAIEQLSWGSSAVSHDDAINSALIMLFKIDKLLEEYKKFSAMEVDVPLIEYYKIKYNYHTAALSSWRGNNNHKLPIMSDGLFKNEGKLKDKAK